MLEVVTLHRLLVENGKASAEFVGSVSEPSPDSALASRIGGYGENLADRNEAAGRAQSAWWVESQPEHVGRLLTCSRDEFTEASASAVKELVKATKPTSKSGLVVMTRTSAASGDSPAVVIVLKLVLGKEELTRFEEHVAAEQAITDETITNVLPRPKDLQKGALIPHPTGAADARVVDEQLQEPAGYWLDFLGLSARPKDPALAKLTAAAAREVLEERIGSQAGTVIAQQLSSLADQPQPVGADTFLEGVAEAGGVPSEAYVTAVLEREPTLADPRAELNPKAMGRVELVITLEGGVKVRGPASSLAGRYQIREPEQGDVWVVELTSGQRPEVREEIKRGRA